MIVQAGFSLVLVGVFLLAAGYNALVFLRPGDGEQGPSVMPVFGGLAGAAGLGLWPYHDLAAWIWLPLLLDCGCGYYLLAGLFLHLRRRWRYRDGNRIAYLSGDSADKSVALSLYRDGRLRLEQEFRQPGRFGSFASDGNWTQSGSGEGYVLSVWGATINLEPRDGRWEILREDGWHARELQLSPISLTRKSG
jgi:hypothetical protein